MIEQLKRVAELQLQYSSQNTVAMQERGHIIRHELPVELGKHVETFKECLGRFGEDLCIEGRDGIGRKTEAPWVRLFSEALSPSATVGYYVVIHFSIDGKRCYVTVGCSASRWDGEKGDLVKRSHEELKSTVTWALSEVSSAGLSTDAFGDQISLGSHLSLPQSFEEATLLAKEFSPHHLDEATFVSAICEAMKILAVIYEAYSLAKDLPASEVNRSDIERTVNPIRRTAGSRQGYGLTSHERKAVEHRAMEVTRKYLEGLGFSLTDTSETKPFDFLAVKEGQETMVEVKGTTSAVMDSILMTANEVNLHSVQKGKTALALVSDISFEQRGANAICKGGTLEFLCPWNISVWSMKPTAFEVRRSGNQPTS